MALSTGSSALWSDINAIYTTLRTVQKKHGLSQTAIPNSQGGSVKASDISTLNNAINALNILPFGLEYKIYLLDA